VYVDNLLAISGYVTKVSSNAVDVVKLEITSLLAYKMKETATPKLSTTCQSQVYSKMCGLEPDRHRMTVTNVPISCLSGFFNILKGAETISIGDTTVEFIPIDGNLRLYDGNLTHIDTLTQTNFKFYNLDIWVGMIVIINGVYRTKVTKIIGDKAYIAMNYLDMETTANTIDFYLPCDKTYGICHKRFNNTARFWGFPNVGKQVNTYDIFSADNLTYCGSDEAILPKDDCPLDDNLFGVII